MRAGADIVSRRLDPSAGGPRKQYEARRGRCRSTSPHVLFTVRHLERSTDRFRFDLDLLRPLTGSARVFRSGARAASCSTVTARAAIVAPSSNHRRSIGVFKLTNIPGQWYSCRDATMPSARAWIASPLRAACFGRSAPPATEYPRCDRAAQGWRLGRHGGDRRRSSGKSPLRRARRRSRFVAAMTRTSTCWSALPRAARFHVPGGRRSLAAGRQPSFRFRREEWRAVCQLSFFGPSRP